MNNHETILAALEAARAFVAPMAEEHETYGHFPGCDYDPRKFSPDEESNTPAEMAAHKAACEAWDRGERPEIASSMGAVEQRGDVLVKHACSSTLGVGGYVHQDEEAAALLAQIDEAIALMGPA